MGQGLNECFGDSVLLGVVGFVVIGEEYRLEHLCNSCNPDGVVFHVPVIYCDMECLK